VPEAADAPEVSVIVPTRSRWHLLSTAALPSALEQEDVRLELIVVDDGSEDETPARLRELADPRVVVIRHEASRGVAVARNTGIRAARGAWVSFLDDDDLWAPRKLRAQLDAADAARAVFAYSGGGGLDESRRFLFAVPPPDPATVTLQLLRWNVIWCGCSNVLARADVITRLGGFDERLTQLADWDLWIRLALSGPAAAATEILVGYVMHQESMLLTDRRDIFPEMDYLVEKHRDAAREHGVSPDQALFTRWVARGHRRAGRRALAARTYLRGVRHHRDVGALPRALSSLVPEPVVDVARRLARVERRSALKTVRVPEPGWVARFRSAAA
jgi:glycosyltransferase involved in cell wall biosynthesis